MNVPRFPDRSVGMVANLLRYLCLLALFACALMASTQGQAEGLTDARAIVPAVAAKIAPETWRKIQAGEVRELLVLFEDAAIDPALARQLRQRGLRTEDATARTIRAERYRTLKARALSALPAQDAELLRDYRHIPMAFLRVRDADALLRLLARAEVVAVFENTRLYPHLTQSLPLIGQPSVNQVMGRTGSGATVAVLDTGVDYTRAEFGSCSAPGVPAGCRVVAALDTRQRTA